jgi:hypothetical protein
VLGADWLLSARARVIVDYDRTLVARATSKGSGDLAAEGLDVLCIRL